MCGRGQAGGEGKGRARSYFACLAHIRSAKWPDLVPGSVCRKETFALARGFRLEAGEGVATLAKTRL